MMKRKHIIPLKKVFGISLLGLLVSWNSFGQYDKVNSRGLDIYFRIFGEGTPILIIGGGPGDVSDRYLSLCEGISKNHQGILVDQRGTGRSTPAVFEASTVSLSLTLGDFEAIRIHRGLKQWAVLGFSYGGYLASLYAATYPASVSSLLLLGSMGLNTEAFSHFNDNITSRLWASDLELYEYWSDPARAAENPKHAIVEGIRARMPGYFYDRKKALSVSQTMKDSDFNLDLGRWIWGDIVKTDIGKMTPKYDKPVLILHGRQDPLGESVPQSLAHYYEKSKLIFIEKCGHYSWIEQADKVFSSIKEFMGNIE
jgi:proline iminopeptidase